MNRTWIALLITLVSVACTRHRPLILGNGLTRIPPANQQFDRKPLNPAVFQYIDTTAMYRSFLPMGGGYSILRFYSNGNFNTFFAEDGRKWTKDDFNPHFQGLRGVYNLVEGKLVFQYYTATCGMGCYAFVNGKIVAEGEVITMIRKSSAPEQYVKHRNLPREFFQWKAEW